MLARSPHYQDVLADAQSAARSMPGKCVEVIDVLSRLQGADMKALAGEMCFEFAAFNHALIELRNAALLLDDHRRQRVD